MTETAATPAPWSPPTGRRSLRRTEAVARAAQLRVTAMRVELDLRDAEADTFGSQTEIEFRSTGPESFADFAGRELVAATLNGHPLAPTSWQDGRIALTELATENTLVVEGRMAYSSDGEGLHRHVDPEDGQTYLYAMSFLDAAPRWFACFDQPDLKAPYELLVTAPPDWTVLGNAPRIAEGPGRWRIGSPEPLSTYFVTLVAGPYASVYAEHDGIRLGFHSRASLRAQLEAEAPDMLTVTQGSFDYYHQLFQRRYPFGEYHQAFVPDFNAGAMENPGCVTFRDSFVFRGRATAADRGKRAGVIAHEMAHQWFGDLVTMRWWDDLWLNESFAEYLAHRCCDATTDYLLWTEFGIIRKDWGSVADQSPSTHPVAGNTSPDAESALQNFDGISYAKGAAVLKQLATHLGDGVFLTGMRTYVDRYAFSNAEFADLMAAWTSAGARDLDAWAHAWLQTTGMDTLDVAGDPPRVSVVAVPPVPSGDGAAATGRPHTVRVGAVDPTGEVRDATQITVSAGAPASVEVPAGASLVVPDAADETWAKIRFGRDGWARVAAVLPRITAEPALVVVYNAIRDGVRDASLAPRVALDLICDTVPALSNELICAYLLAFAQDELAAAYCPVPERTARLGRVNEAAHRLLTSSAAGSDRQLEGFRLTVRSSRDADLLSTWNRGEHLPDGIALDPDLAWLIVHRLAATTGQEAVIEDALAADPSAAAHVAAARARAALPTAEAKAAAWSLLMSQTPTSAYELYATAEGFFHPLQTELTQAYVPRYFAEIGGTADFRSGWVLREVAIRAFPSSAATTATVELADRALAADLASLVRRALLDGTDHLRRAVASLASFD